ncbi:MAG: MFS transporter [Melioribacteraceae bacterium]|nr:MFS transporter [Melioribacteraceae bacterium]MCF8264365.1 MFS transporter [Melioribacteraceae bacterium]
MQPGQNQSKFKVFIWSLYDFANTSYAIVVVTFLFAVYFKKVIAEDQPIGDLYWSIGTSVSMLITAIISPILGAIADYSFGKKRFLLFFTLICIAGTGLMYFLEAGMIFWALVLFIISNIGFEAGLVFYDAFLPEITTEKNYGRVSGYGFAMGYFGSLTVLGLAFPFIQNDMIKETFPLSAIFFLVFALPLFFVLKDLRKDREPDVSYVKIGFNRVYNTIAHLKTYKNLAYFLLAYFFYIEGVNTVIYFSGNYASTTLKFSMQELIVFFIIVQSTAILGSVVFGILSDSIGQKKSIVISLFIWIFTMLLAFYTSNSEYYLMVYFRETFGMESIALLKYSFYFVGILAGSVMGATQSTSRSLMSKLTPEEKKTEFFGFYSFFGKSSAIMGPVVFGLVSYLTGNQRIAILSIIIFFIVGLILIRKVKDDEGTD